MSDWRQGLIPCKPWNSIRPERNECKRVTIDQGDHDYREPLWCGLFRTDVSLDGYCAWGKRREESE